MKKFFVTLAAALIAFSLSAQRQSGKTFALELQGSLGYSLMSGFGDLSGGLAGDIGVEGIYKFNDLLGLGLGLSYYYLNSDKINNEGFVFHNLEIPLLLHLDVTKHFGLYAGFKGNFILSAKHTYANDKASLDVKDIYNSAYFQIPVGIRFYFNAPCSLGVHYDIAVSKMSNDINPLNSKISPIMLTFAYRFDL